MHENGIKRLTSIIDSDLRNAIAHLNFAIKENEIYVKGRPAPEVVLASLIELRIGIGTAENLLTQLAKERGISK